MITLDRRRVFGSGGELPYEKQYLTLEAVESGTFTLTIPSGKTVTALESVSYSLNGGVTWTTTNNVNNTEVVITTPSVAIGDKVLWKGIGTAYGVDNNNYTLFRGTGKYKVYGNIMSLLYGDSFIGNITIYQRSFSGLFANDSKLVDAENIILPSTTLATHCYSYMFRNTKITVPPILPATTLAQSCYQTMFRDTPITVAPDVIAQTTVSNCFYNMFYSCTLLNSVRILCTNYVSNAFTGWLSGVASTGTIYKKAELELPLNNVNGVPSNWTVVEI